MCSRWPALRIQDSTTSLTDCWPSAMFSPIADQSKPASRARSRTVLPSGSRCAKWDRASMSAACGVGAGVDGERLAAGAAALVVAPRHQLGADVLAVAQAGGLAGEGRALRHGEEDRVQRRAVEAADGDAEVGG